MRDPEFIVIPLCLWGMVDLVGTVVGTMVLVMALMLHRKHVNFTLRLIENLLSSNGVHGVMPVFQTSSHSLKIEMA